MILRVCNLEGLTIILIVIARIPTPYHLDEQGYANKVIEDVALIVVVPTPNPTKNEQIVPILRYPLHSNGDYSWLSHTNPRPNPYLHSL